MEGSKKLISNFGYYNYSVAPWNTIQKKRETENDERKKEKVDGKFKLGKLVVSL